MVNGTGPIPAEFMVVGSEPGYHEMRRGIPFVGPTGAESDRLLAVAGLARDAVFLTNVYREAKVDKVPHTREQLDYGIARLREELEAVEPRHIITYGREAARLFLGDVDMDEVWGLHLVPPAETFVRLPELRQDVTILPQTHPAAGFHSPEASTQTMVGFEEMARVLRTGEPARGLYDDPIPNPCYEVWERFPQFVMGLPQTGPNGSWEAGFDTEGYPHRPWSGQLSSMAGEAGLFRYDNAEAMDAFRTWLLRKPRLVMHSALHDLKMARAMGVDLIELGIEFDDTQLMAYLLGAIPQGLKPLAVRELAMPMQSYKEVLGDAQDRHARTYLTAVWDEEMRRHRELCEAEFRFRRDVQKRRVRTVPDLPKSLLLRSVERCLGSKDPARLWGDQVEDRHTEAYSSQRAEMPEASLSDVDPAVALRYAARDPDATLRLKHKLWPRIQAKGLEEVYRLDLGTYPILDDMMRTGITPDIAAFGRLANRLDAELSELRDTLRTVTADPAFNANSGDQVAAYLFDELRLDSPGRMTSSGRESTNDKVLEALEKLYPEVPAVAQIRSYREYYKLRWTFVERLPEMVKRWPFDGRLHCELMLTRTPSGRLAAKNPNLLAMPKHGKFAKDFRRCFVPGLGRLFLSADESQVELRVLAHLSQDPVMCAIFRGEKRNPDGSVIDLHAAMAQRIFGVEPKDQDESKHRLPSKAVNFGLPMGMTAVGLCLELRKGGLDVDEDDAQRWIDDADALYTEVPGYKQRCITEAQRNGYIRCLSGRIRYIGGIRNRDERVRAEAERFAFSTPIQEGAQWIGKRALARAWRDVYVPLRKAGRYCRPVLWTHDDLLTEVEDGDLALQTAPRIKEILTDAPPGFSVPLQTSPELGHDWANMVKL